jgi:O-antigen/teichoic acid export membrane protein
MKEFFREHFFSQSLEVCRILVGGLYAVFAYGLVGAEAFGFFSGLAALAGYGFLFEGTQIAQGFQVDYRKSPSAELFTTAFLLLLTCSFILGPLALLLCYYGTDHAFSYCAWFSLIHSATPLRTFFNNFLVIKEKVTFTIVSEIISKLMALGFFYVVYIQTGQVGLGVLLCANGVDTLANILINAGFSLSQQHFGSFKFHYAQSLLRYAWPLIASSFGSGFIFKSVKVVFLKNLSVEDFGRLSFLDGVMEKLKGPTSLYVVQRLPNMIDAIQRIGFVATSRDEFRRLWKFSMVLCLLITVGIVITEPLMNYPLFARFAEMKGSLYCVAYFIVLRAYAGLACQLVIASRKNYVEAFGSFISISIQFLVASVAVVGWGFYGALFAICLNSITTGVVNYIIALKMEMKIMRDLREGKCAE